MFRRTKAASAAAARAAPPEAAAPDVRSVTAEERVRIERENRRLLEEDLAAGNLAFASRPYEAIVQFSNFCNMSCVMCWNGNNPSLRRISPELLRALSVEVAPSLSVVLPYYGSEPLVLTWAETRRLAEQHSLQLSIATNAEFLDLARCRELLGIVETLYLSIDSHDPETYARIRPGSRPEKVFENLRTAARFCRENRIECIANVVFMLENSARLAETVAYFAEVGVPSVTVSQLVDVNGRNHWLDPHLHLSAEDIEAIRARCVSVAAEKGLRLIWAVGGHAVHDFRAEPIGPTERKAWNDRWFARFRRLHPRYCKSALMGVRIDAGGDVAPCCYATDGELSLGRLGDAPFERIWNGPSAQDLRRGMQSDDVPALCQGCRMRDAPPPEAHRPFVDRVDVLVQRSLAHLESSIEVVAPAHAARLRHRPRLCVRDERSIDTEYFLGWSPGGEAERTEACALVPEPRGDGAIEFELPAPVWKRLERNLGYWWCVFAVPRDARIPPRRSSEIRCLIRQEDRPRVAGSQLRYAEQRRASMGDFGGEKQASWSAPRESVPPR